MTRSSDNRFLRAINLRYDLGHPSRLEHFQPTAKSVELISAVCGLRAERAFIVTAAYGTGKSLSAAIAGEAVAPTAASHGLLKLVAQRMVDVDKELTSFFRTRAAPRSPRGLLIVLEGYCDDSAAAFIDATIAAFRRANVPVTRKALLNGTPNAAACLLRAAHLASEKELDRISVVWDEFGRHLEGLVRAGKAEGLSELQQLAETASRLSLIPASLTLLLHQGFSLYATELSQAARNEWKKIEGRFSSIQYVDDSVEMYRLLGRVISAKRASSVRLPAKVAFQDAARYARKLKLFDAFSSVHALADVLEEAYPFHPAVLYLLPRLSARVAQNERTMFSFIAASSDVAEPVTMTELYDFFAPAMRSDASLGGTYRHWLETESALTKAQTQEEEHVLKAAALMGMGLVGQRQRVGRDTLAFSSRGYGKVDYEKAIRGLTKRKLLLYRRHNDDLSVWHGTDVDLRGRLDEEKVRARPEFNAVEFLAFEYPAPIWHPVVHNSRFLLRRYFSGRYVDAAELLASREAHSAWRLKLGEDGAVLYAIPKTKAEITGLEALAREMPLDAGLVLVIPREPSNVYETTLEVFVLSRLQKDSELIGDDPLVLPELRQMTDDARQYLDRSMGRLFNPADNGPQWWSRGERLQVASSGQLRRQLSRLMDARFPQTARINNESIVRSRLSRPMVNARKKVVLGILERSGLPQLAFDGTTPDASIYRTVLEASGLYTRKASGQWGWANSDAIGDRGLRAVWSALGEFLTAPSMGNKHPKALFDKLMAPPYGVRPGLFPVLVAAAMRAFPSALTIMRGGEYLPDVLPGDIEALCSNPEDFTVKVYPLDDPRRDYLRGLAQVFQATAHTEDSDLVRNCYDALIAWRQTLPSYALETTQLDGKVRQFQAWVRDIKDPANLFLEMLPELGDGATSPELLPAVAGWRDAVASVARSYEASAVKALEAAFILSENDGLDVMAAMVRWGSCVPNEVVDGLDSVGKAIVRLAKQAEGSHYTGPSLAAAVSMVLLGKRLDQWDDQTERVFLSSLREVIAAVESMAVNSGAPGASELVKNRLRGVYTKLAEMSGDTQARLFLQTLIDGEALQYGGHKRSASG